jgi:hypothetical protein
MKRIDKNIAVNQGSYAAKDGRCQEAGKWPQNLDFDCDDKELAAFYDHAEDCPFHSEVVKVANTDFARSLLKFNCRLKASAEPEYTRYVLVGVTNWAEQNDSEKGMQANGMNDTNS